MAISDRVPFLNISNFSGVFIQFFHCKSIISVTFDFQPAVFQFNVATLSLDFNIIIELALLGICLLLLKPANKLLFLATTYFQCLV